MENKYKIYALLIGLLALQSCDTVYHFDAAQYFKSKNYNKEMPFNMYSGNISPVLFAQRGETKSNVTEIPKNSDLKNTRWFKSNRFNFSAAFLPGGGDLKLTYSPAKKIMFTVNLAGASIRSSEKGNISVAYTRYEDYGWGYDSAHAINGFENFVYYKELTIKQSQKDFSLGYYSSFGNHGIYEAMAGWGFGTTKSEYEYNIENNGGYNAIFSESRNYYKIFLQNNLGFATKVTEGGLCMRLTYVRFTSQNFNAAYEIQTYEMKNEHLLLEPAFHFGAGGKKFRGFMEYGFAFPFQKTDVDWNETFRVGASFQL